MSSRASGYAIAVVTVTVWPRSPCHVIEVALTPRSRFEGKTIATVELRQLFGVTVLGVRRLGQPFSGDLAHEPLRFGDTLLVAGAPAQLEAIVRSQQTFGDLAIVAFPRDMVASDQLSQRAWLAIAIMGAMLITMATGWLPIVTIALTAAVAMMLGGAVSMKDVYQRLNWESLVLIAAILPMATALTKTDGATLIANWLPYWEISHHSLCLPVFFCDQSVKPIYFKYGHCGACYADCTWSCRSTRVGGLSRC